MRRKRNAIVLLTMFIYASILICACVANQIGKENSDLSSNGNGLDAERLEVTKEEIIEKFNENYDDFTGLVEYLADNPIRLFCIYNKNTNKLLVSIDNTDYVDFSIDNEALSGVKRYIENIICSLDFMAISDYLSIGGGVNFTYNSGSLSRGIEYSKVGLVEQNTVLNKRNKISENWYYWEAAH